MNKRTILNALDRIELDVDDPRTVAENAAVIRCELRDVEMPPVTALDGAAIEFEEGRSYLVFLQRASVHPVELRDIMPRCRYEATFIFCDGIGPLRDMVHAVTLQPGETMVFVRPGTVDMRSRLAGVRFVEVSGAGSLADAVLLRPDPLAAALEVCENPQWADGMMIAEEIRRL